MTIAKNQHWITFGGEPVTGRTPARVLVYGPELTGEQTGAVAHVYKLFCDALLVTPSKFLVQNRTFEDGTRVRMTSIQGVDEVAVWTTPKSPEELVGDLFVAVPAASGTGGAFDREQYRPASWRNYLKTRAPSALKSSSVPLPDHPGHITWTGGRFVVDGRPVLLSWRGPEDRYSIFKGDGGGRYLPWPTDTPIVDEFALKHVWRPNTIVSAPFNTLDSSFVWFNGLKVDTGVRKVIAAALFMPDEENSANVVLRVCTDEFPEGSGTRAWAVYDLTPQGVAVAECTIKKLMSAKLPLVKQATYPATDYKYVPGEALPDDADIGTWVDYHRPHFDSRGERLATVIRRARASRGPGYRNGFDAVGAVFSMPGWEIVSEVKHLRVSSEDTEDRGEIVAIDFLRAKDPDMPDEVVHVETLTSVTWVEVLAADKWEYTFAGTVSITHSKHGKLKEGATSGGGGRTGDARDAQYEWFWADPYSWWQPPSSRTRFSFVGDLSRDIFAVGVASETSPGVSGQLGPYVRVEDHNAEQVITRTISNPTVWYTVYIDGGVAADGLDGGKADDNAGDEVQYRSLTYLPRIPPYRSISDFVSIRSGAFAAHPAGLPDSNLWNTQRAETPGYAVPFPNDSTQILPIYAYSAVDVTRRIAYLGTNVSGKANGFNAVVRDLAPGSTGQKVTQLGAETWTAPLFLGPQPKGK